MERHGCSGMLAARRRPLRQRPRVWQPPVPGAAASLGARTSTATSGTRCNALRGAALLPRTNAHMHTWTSCMRWHGRVVVLQDNGGDKLATMHGGHACAAVRGGRLPTQATARTVWERSAALCDDSGAAAGEQATSRPAGGWRSRYVPGPACGCSQRLSTTRRSR